MESPIPLHVHRQDHNSSKLPSFRLADINKTSTTTLNHHNNHNTTTTILDTPPQSPPSSNLALDPPSSDDSRKEQYHPHHLRHQSDAVNSTTPRQTLRARPKTSIGVGPIGIPGGTIETSRAHAPPKPTVPAARSGNNALLGKGPPPAMLTQKSSFQALDIENSTKDWVVNQSALAINTTASNNSSSSTSPLDDKKSPPPANVSPLTQTTSTPVTPLIPPIRGFRTSRKSSAEMNGMSPRRVSVDQDETLRALEGFAQRPANREQEEQNSDDSDLFLKLAREESSSSSNPRSGPIRRSTLNRQSLPPNSTVFQSANFPRRGSEEERGPRLTEGQALPYRPFVRERGPSALDVSRSRQYGDNSYAVPATPRGAASREISPESQNSYRERRDSNTEPGLPGRNAAYRQSNLSYAAARSYNSSPLVARTLDRGDRGATEPPHAAEGTESTVSTTGDQSTIWDEVEEMKSRIQKLELSRTLPPTSGAAISRASNDRPATATTTVTTMSSSPKRGRGYSISPTDVASMTPTSADAHPLLTSALAKSKPLLRPEVYGALEAAAADALSIASMMGVSGQQGPMSSSQSTIGAGSNMAYDRQARRKAESMCRSLTELCLALSEGVSEQHPPVQSRARAGSQDSQMHGGGDNVSRPPISSDLSRVKSSPRGFSRAEGRRSSMLAGSSLPSPRYNDAGTPTQSSMAGRRTSLLLRSRRAGTEEPDEDDESRFRAPSRATTDIGRLRNSPREYASQQSLQDQQIPPVPSSLPVRRHYASSSLPHASPSALPTLSNQNSRRYLDRSTPDRDIGLASRLAEDRGQRKSLMGPGQAVNRGQSIRRSRQMSTDLAAEQGGGFQ